jgi:hypothetical protein
MVVDYLPLPVMGLLQFSDPASNLFKSIRALFQDAEEATAIDVAVGVLDPTPSK